MAVLVLQPLAVERRAAGGGAQQEAAAARVAERPDLVADALEAEHRVEDVERDHRLAVGGVGGAGGGEGGHRAGLGDPLLEDLAVLRLAVGEQELGVHRLVALAQRGVDPDLRNSASMPKVRASSGMIGTIAPAERRVADQLPQQPDEGHGRRDRDLVSPVPRRTPSKSSAPSTCSGSGTPRRHGISRRARGAARACTRLLGLPARVVVRRVLELDRRGSAARAGRGTSRSSSSFSFLIWWVTLRASTAAAERPALDRLGQDHGGRAAVLDGRLVGGVDLAVVVAAAAQALDLVVAQVLDQLRRRGSASEEVLADVGAALDRVPLAVAVQRLVHPLDQHAVRVARQQVVPLAPPDDLDHVPAGAAEDRLQLLDDLAVAAHRAVEPLQVAVDDEDQVVEPLARGQRAARRAPRARPSRRRRRRPRPATPAVSAMPRALQVAVEARLVDRR